AQDREIAEKSGRAPLAIKSIHRTGAKKKERVHPFLLPSGRVKATDMPLIPAPAGIRPGSPPSRGRAERCPHHPASRSTSASRRRKSRKRRARMAASSSAVSTRGGRGLAQIRSVAAHWRERRQARRGQAGH